MGRLKVFSMFSGYGGDLFALQKAGIEYESVGCSEIDKYAIQCHDMNHSSKNYGDCTKINPEELPDFDLMTGGFPCQSFSISGKRLGLEDTRGTLFNEIIRIAKVKKPTYMLLENVKGLVNHDNGRTFRIILKAIQKIGYGVIYKVLNSKDHGTPQNRERIFFACKLGGWDFMEFQFPNREKLNLSIRDILEEDVDEKYHLSEKMIKTILSKDGTSYENKINPLISNTLRTNYSNAHSNETYVSQINQLNNGRQGQRLYGIDGISPTLDATAQGKMVQVHNMQPRSPDRPSLKYSSGGSGHLQRDDVAYCIDTGNTNTVEFDNRTIRRLTPIECFRLQGFLDIDIKLDGISETQRYKMAGNGWELSVVSKIFRTMFKGRD